MRTADSTRTHSLLMASAASAVPKTVRAAPAIQKISVVVCGGVLAKKIKPTMASIFKKIEVPEMSSFTRRLSCLRAYPDLSDVDKSWSQDAKQIGQKVKATSLVRCRARNFVVASAPHSRFQTKLADLFISFFNPKITGMTSRKIGECAVYVYGSKEYRKRYGLPKTKDELQNHRFVSYISEMVTIESVRWLEELVPNPNVVFATNSIISQTNAATSGIGLVVLPIFVGSEARALFQVLPDVVVIYRPIWLSVTKDQSGIASIRSAVEIITELFSTDQSYLIGRKSEVT